jgi:hypothetical protein
VLRTDFDTDEAPLSWRNGKVSGQERRRLDGVPAWHMGSDWNQLFVRLPEPLPDVFAVQVQVFAPPPRQANTSAGLVAFTDPAGPLDSTTSDLRHGRGVNLSEDKGHAPSLSWGLPQGEHSTRVDYRAGTDGPFTGQWRTLRLEGSRSGRWLRLLLDGRLLLADAAASGLDGRHVALTGQGDVYGEAGVQWKHLMVFEGGADCR